MLIIGLAVAGCAPTAPASGIAQAPPDLVARSEALADDFQGRLQAELASALAAGGPSEAVKVCAESAPRIAYELSQRSGAEITRVSLRPRNPGAAADGDLADRLKALAERPLDAQGRPAAVHWIERGSEHAGPAYMRAVIMRDQPCAACHGVAVADDVKATIAAYYPNDQATGFKAGEMRGAILVRWPQAGLEDRAAAH